MHLVKASYGDPLLDGLLFLNPDGTWLPTSELYKAPVPSLSGGLDREMQRRGWPAGDDVYREDLIVYFDDEHRILVQVH